MIHTPPAHHASPVSRRLAILMGVCALAAGGASLQAQNLTKTWDGGAGTSTWLDAANWNNDSLPATGTGTNGDNLLINFSGDLAPVYSAASGTNTYRRLLVGDGTNANGVVTFTGGAFSTDNTAQTRIGNSSNGRGTLNVSGGTVGFGGTMQVGLGGGIGVVNLSGGTLTSARNNTINSVTAVSMVLGEGNSSATTGTFNLSGGTFRTRTGVLVGTSTGGVGSFNVGGAGLAQIGHENASDDGFWYQRSTGTLKATVDSNGFTLGTIDIFDATNVSYITFDEGAKLEVGFSGVAPSVSMTWNLMTYETGRTVTGAPLLVGTDIANWSYAFVDLMNGTSALQLSYSAIPEPSAFAALAGLGALGLVASRRRRR